MTENFNILKNISNASPLSKTQLEKAEVQCDGINLLIKSKQLCKEGIKEYQMAAMKKFKSVIPFYEGHCI